MGAPPDLIQMRHEVTQNALRLCRYPSRAVGGRLNGDRVVIDTIIIPVRLREIGIA